MEGKSITNDWSLTAWGELGMVEVLLDGMTTDQFPHIKMDGTVVSGLLEPIPDGSGESGNDDEQEEDEGEESMDESWWSSDDEEDGDWSYDEDEDADDEDESWSWSDEDEDDEDGWSWDSDEDYYSDDDA